MTHAIIGTAGHVDHGKTCLIQALTGVDTDRLPQEKARGLTIELGFAPLTFPDGLRAGIVDVPGHERYIRHMLCGAAGMDLAMLVVAADEGFMPQTAEHLEILQLLGVREGLVVLTKADLADEARLEQVGEALRRRVRGTFLEGKPLLSVSARTGQGLSELRETLHRMLLALPARKDRGPFRLPIDRVFTVEGFGTVVTGTLLEGVIRQEDLAEISPAGRMGRVRGLQVFGEAVEAVYAGQRAAVNLSGVKREDLRRGDALILPGSLEPSLLLDVRLELLDSSRHTLRSGTQVRLHHGAAVRLARVALLEGETLPPGRRGYAQLRLEEPLAAGTGDRFVLRQLSPAETLGGGVILDPVPRRRHRRGDMAVLEALAVKERGSLDQRFLQVLKEAGGEMGLSGLAAALSLPEEALTPALRELLSQGQVLELLPGRYLAAEVRDRLQQRCLEVLEAYHRANPLQAGIRAAELRQRTGGSAALLEHLVKRGVLRRVGERYALPAFRIGLTRRQEAIRRTILGLCAGQGRHTPGPAALTAKFPLRDREDCRRVLESLLSEGTLVLLAPEVLCHAGDLAAYQTAAADWLSGHETLTLAQFRDLLGTSRDYALLVLEYFDRLGLTRREGDLRRPGPAAPDSAR